MCLVFYFLFKNYYFFYLKKKKIGFNYFDHTMLSLAENPKILFTST